MPLSSLIALALAAAAPVPVDQQSWIGANDFPKKAQREGLTGAVVYRLAVDSGGRVRHCEIATSSGQPPLDKATCALLKERARFTPATDAGSHAIASVFGGTVRWALPAPPAPIMLGAPRWTSPVTNRSVPPLMLARTPSTFGAPPQSSARPMPVPVEDPAATAPPSDPRVIRGQLGNGLRYAILPNNVPWGTLSFRMRVAGGALDEKPDQAGYAHLVEHMTFRGSPAVSDGQLSRTLSEMGLSFGTDSNAFTTPEDTFFVLDFPVARASAFATGLFLLREIAGNAAIAAPSLESERGVVLAERRQQEDPSHRAGNARLDFLLDGQPVARHDPIGTIASINGVTAPRLTDYYHDHYRPDRTTLIVVGNVDPVRTVADIQARFGDWQAAAQAPAIQAEGMLTPRPPTARLFVEPGAPELVQLNWIAPYDPAPDGYARQKRRLTQWLAASILNERLERAAESPDAPFIGAHAQIDDLFLLARNANIGLVPADGKLAPAIEAVILAQRRLIEQGVTAPELARARPPA
jgi:zinc protease